MRTIVSILVLALLAAIATVIFALGNSGVVTVHFLKWSFDSSLTLLMLAPFALGLLLGWLVTVPTQIKKSLTIRANKKLSNDHLSDADLLDSRGDTLEPSPLILP
jgi:uncharacterized integral membrane protein